MLGVVEVAVGAVVATWVATDASRVGYRRLTETVESVASIDVSARTGGRFDIGLLPRLVDLAGCEELPADRVSSIGLHHLLCGEAGEPCFVEITHVCSL